MLNLIFIADFLLCLGMAAGAILFAHQLTATYSDEFPRHYFYYLAAFYGFAVYGIWGQIATRAVLGSLDVPPDVIETAANLLPLLGVPFLFISWLMLLTMAGSLFAAPLKAAWMPVHAAIFLVLIAGAWLAVDVLQTAPAGLAGSLLGIETAVLVGLEALYVAAFLILALRFGARQTAGRRRALLAFTALLVGGFVARSAALPLAFRYPWVVAAVLVYFGSNLAPLLYIWLSADRIFEPVKAETTSAERMERLFEQHGVTKRERQIVREICTGKTNREIAETLFISLQTVKDHTHRIYSKLGISSRIQLVQKMSE